MRKSFDRNDHSRVKEDKSDFKRKNSENDESEQININEKAEEYIKDCLAEKEKINKDMPIASRLIDEEIEKVQTTGRIPTRDRKYADIYREKPIRVAQKILVPVREHPKFNFVGKLLGPKGNSLRRLQEETLCRMTVLGRNSMKDRAKEEELRASKDPKYAHLNDDLHVEVSTVAPPAEAHARIAYAMAELRKYLIPDSNDVIRQEQLRELMDNPSQVEYNGRPPAPYKRTLNSGPKQGYGSPAGAQSGARTVMAPKQKILSILDRARTAMDESYSRPHYEEPIPYEAPPYEGYSYGHAPQANRGPPYEGQDYETPDYRHEYYTRSPTYNPVKGSASSSSVRPSWKNSVGASPYSSSRRNDDLHTGSSSSKHAHSAREARYKSAPYAKPK